MEWKFSLGYLERSQTNEIGLWKKMNYMDVSYLEKDVKYWAKNDSPCLQEVSKVAVKQKKIKNK